MAYTLPWPAYGCDWMTFADSTSFIALASFLPNKRNELLILRALDLAPVGLPLAYKMAATKIAFSPSNLLAVAGSDVTLYKLSPESGHLDQMNTLSSSTSLKRNSIASDGVVIPDQSNMSHNSSAPITSVSWCPVDPSLLLTASYDTTCTIWNVETGGIKTQLIAHDKEVFDVAFSPVRSDSFVSVGAEGSLRLFDTRYFAHCLPKF